MLRDTQGIAASPAIVPMALLPIITRLDGTATCAEIAREASREAGETVPVGMVVKLATELEESLFAAGPAFDRAYARAADTFRAAAVRPASHAGGAYHDDPIQLASYIEQECFAKAKADASAGERALIALVAPHIDPWRGARSYGEAYGGLARNIPDDVETFILLGTSHAPMREPFSLCRKAFATPLGDLEADTAAIDAITSACDFDPYADQLNHKREHSLEFQAVFLRHLLGGARARRARIVPILAGLGAHQATGRSPRGARAVERFLDALRRLVHDTGAVVIAGADLAHVGPRFGDDGALDEGGRRALDATDRESLDRAVAGDAEGFWSHVAGDLETRRVCGLAPIYTLLRTLPEGATGALRHYEQTVDPDEGSIVSHAAVGFFA